MCRRPSMFPGVAQNVITCRCNTRAYTEGVSKLRRRLPNPVSAQGTLSARPCVEHAEAHHALCLELHSIGDEASAWCIACDATCRNPTQAAGVPRCNVSGFYEYCTNRTYDVGRRINHASCSFGLDSSSPDAPSVLADGCMHEHDSQ